MKYALAGFTNSINGLWTFLDITEGDYISFLYGARVRGLYRVVKKVAYKNAENLPPWPPVTFSMSGNTYYFPFRLFLKQERNLDEPLVRPEFAYVAENLLLRGGYRKTHFQADKITVYNASQMGEPYYGLPECISFDAESFEPKIVFKKEYQKIPEKFYFQELILQSLVRRKIRDSVLNYALEFFKVDNSLEVFEILGEKALPEGFVDIFVKLKHPQACNKYILGEVKTGRVQKKDVEQLIRYINEFRNEAIGGLLIAKDFSSSVCKDSKILFIKYYFENFDISHEYSYDQLLELLKLEIME
jgi:hypothetical protein